jgi:hypothetical protein
MVTVEPDATWSTGSASRLGSQPHRTVSGDETT